MIGGTRLVPTGTNAEIITDGRGFAKIVCCYDPGCAAGYPKPRHMPGRVFLLGECYAELALVMI